MASMTAAERTDLRNLQDRFLELPIITNFVERNGEDQYIFEPGSPTIRQVRETLHPTYEHMFRQYVTAGESTE